MTVALFILKSFFLILMVFAATVLFVIFIPATLLKIRFVLREVHMKKLADQFGFNWKSNPPSFKKCLLIGLFSYRSTKEDWKTNFMEGVIGGHKILIYDNLLINFLPVYTRRTIISVDDQELPGKELETNFIKLQDGFLTSVWKLKRLLNKLSLQKK